MVRLGDSESADEKREREHYAALWKFLREHGKAPYEYKWSGYTLYDLLDWLKEVKKIDLMETQFIDSKDESFIWYVFDKKTREQNQNKLNPANFKAQDVSYSYHHLLEQRQEADIKEMAAKLDHTKFKQYMAIANEHAQSESRFGLSNKERGTAMMEGITIIHKYLKLIEGSSVVILNIG